MLKPAGGVLVLAYSPHHLQCGQNTKLVLLLEPVAHSLYIPVRVNSSAPAVPVLRFVLSVLVHFAMKIYCFNKIFIYNGDLPRFFEFPSRISLVWIKTHNCSHVLQ